MQRVAKNPSRDFQREVWVWERQTGLISYDPSRRLSVEACRVFIDQCCFNLHIATPKIVFRRGNKEDASAHKFFDEDDAGIYWIMLPPWACTKETMLHELAHVMTDIGPHDREFVETYIDLLSRFAGHDIGKLVASAESYGMWGLFE